ncbi:MAG TPA: hypothetical protein VD886_00345, partial [Herpetosiphonaceae bacterium]|nr:hypothetical protein [Herpetosiphonaceae bacterium]
LDGDTLVVGAPYEDSGAAGVNGDQNDNSVSESGAAYVFVRTAAGWSQPAYLKASNPGVSDFFGYSVAVSGDTIVVGAVAEASASPGVNGDQADNSIYGAGAAYVFVRTAGGWSQQAYLKASNPDASDLFGHSVAISGDTIAVGAYGESSGATGANGNQQDDDTYGSGAAYVFARADGGWSQQAYLKASNPHRFDRFGYSVAIDGDTVVVTAPLEPGGATGVGGDQADTSAPNAGAAYVFARADGGWSQQAYLKASNTDTYDQFGFSSAISGETIVIGAQGESSAAAGVDGDQQDNSADHAGAAYVFARTGATWSQQAYLKASNPDREDMFSRVAIDGDWIGVGALYESSAATGINGDQHDNSSLRAGAAYAFVRTGAAWRQRAYVKASNPGSHDAFGVSVAIDDSTLIAGAVGESSAATGVDGIQDNNSAARSGAAYAVPLPAASLYLPLVSNAPAMPDLVGSIALSPARRAFAAGEPVLITATITNTGDAPSPAVWADLYINPAPPPSAPNAPWYESCGLDPCTGIAWRVPPLAPGAHVTLTSASYAAEYTIWPGFFVAGTTDIYLFVDSYDASTTTGAALERNEQNNRAEIHGLSVTGPLPGSAAIPRLPRLIPARPRP